MPPDTQDGTTEAPKYITAEDLTKAIDAKLGSWAKTFEKKNSDTIKGALGELAPQLDQILEAKLEHLKKPTEGTPGGAAGGEGAAQPRPEDHPAFKGLQRQVALLQESNKKAEDQRLAAEAKEQALEMRQKVTEELGRHGIKTHAKGAYALLADRLKRDEYGKIVVTDEDGSEFDLRAGIETFAKTSEAKIYMEPRNAAGSGGRAQTAAAATTRKSDAASLEDIGQFVLAHAAPFKLGE